MIKAGCCKCLHKEPADLSWQRQPHEVMTLKCCNCPQLKPPLAMCFLLSAATLLLLIWLAISCMSQQQV